MKYDNLRNECIWERSILIVMFFGEFHNHQWHNLKFIIPQTIRCSLKIIVGWVQYLNDKRSVQLFSLINQLVFNI